MERLCPVVVRVLGYLSCPGLGPSVRQCSGPAASAAAALQRARSGTRTAGTVAACTGTPPCAPPQGLAHSLCSLGDGWGTAVGHPAMKGQELAGPSRQKPPVSMPVPGRTGLGGWEGSLCCSISRGMGRLPLHLPTAEDAVVTLISHLHQPLSGSLLQESWGRTALAR